MSSEAAVRISHVEKTYRIYAKPHHRLVQGLPLIGGARWYSEFTALKGVSLEVSRGETVGIIGRNGSGKSTLLQVICGTLSPTSGTVEVGGRIAALLELGAGFNPEFTGKENVFLNAAVLGLSRQEVEARFDRILKFADIGDFIDRPVKTYSSGMYIRLAFAVAINTDPQVLVVDEALSVGDEAFQRKCFARIEELKDAGCTILFVSHSAGSVVQLCDRAIVMDAGENIFTGAPKDAVALYQRLLYAPETKRAEIRQAIALGLDALQLERDDSQARDGEVRPAFALSDVENLERFDPNLKAESTVELASHGATILDPRFENEKGQRVNVLVPGAKYVYRYRVRFDQAAAQVHFGMMIKSLTGVELFGMASHPELTGIASVAAGSVFDVRFYFLSSFLPGTYFTNAGCMGSLEDGESRFLHRILDAVMFKVETRTNDRRKAGFYDLSAEPACSYYVVEHEAGVPAEADCP
jgi:homopolymeric O-antigen transport system ATP-binding protein